MNDPNNIKPRIVADDDIVFEGVLSKDEARKIWEAVRRGGAIDETEAEKLVLWAINVRQAKGCLDLLLEGFITVDGWTGGEPDFGLPELDALSEFELSLPMLEESKC